MQAAHTRLPPRVKLVRYIPGRRSNASASHSVSQRALAPPLELARTHSGWYFDERRNRSENNRASEDMWISLA